MSDRAVFALHEKLIEEFGGTQGIANKGLVESALTRPRNLFLYEKSSIQRLAACYAHGICQNYGFVDGNKRTAFVTMRVFLRKNGFDLTATEAELVETFLALAAVELSEDALFEWLMTHSQKLP